MQVSLSSGGYDIIDSGHIFLFGEDKDLKMDITANNGFEISLILKFSKDTSNEQKIQKDISENTIILTCINFQNEGTGLATPVRIAAIDGKELYLMFWSYLEGKDEIKSRSVKYTLFYEK